MRNAGRPAKPAALRRNARRWKQELLAALQQNPLDPKRVKKCFDRYRHSDVRIALDKMYGGRCCYCESEIGVVADGHIEHRKPKRRFPGHCFDWNNLHLACPKCNQAKGDNWKARAPILDAVVDIPIDKHLTYGLKDVLGVIRSVRTPRGKTTVDDTDLNREKLRNARTQVFVGVMGVMAELKDAGRSPRVAELRLELEEKARGEYGSLVRWLLDTFPVAA